MYNQVQKNNPNQSGSDRTYYSCVCVYSSDRIIIRLVMIVSQIRTNYLVKKYDSHITKKWSYLYQLLSSVIVDRTNQTKHPSSNDRYTEEVDRSYYNFFFYS